MSNLLLPRPPAFAALRPALPEFERVEAPEDAALRACVGGGRVLRRKGASPDRAGYYLHRAPDGSTAFLKVVPAAHAQRQREANALAEWVAERGVRTALACAGFPKELDADHT